MIAALALAASVAVTPPSVEGLAFGMGATSCSDWLARPVAWTPVNEWVQGYWSGLNTGGRPDVGIRMNSVGVVTRVRDLCASRPHQTVLTSVLQAYRTASYRGD